MGQNCHPRPIARSQDARQRPPAHPPPTLATVPTPHHASPKRPPGPAQHGSDPARRCRHSFHTQAHSRFLRPASRACIALLVCSANLSQPPAFGRLASSSSSVGSAAMLQWSSSPRSIWRSPTPRTKRGFGPKACGSSRTSRTPLGTPRFPTSRPDRPTAGKRQPSKAAARVLQDIACLARAAAASRLG
jgi:hypothetical protein